MPSEATPASCLAIEGGSVIEDGPASAAARPAGATRRRRQLPLIDAQRCTGCGRCVGACDEHLLSLECHGWEKSAVLHDADRCTGCMLCARACPFHAITMQPRAAATGGPAVR